MKGLTDRQAEVLEAIRELTEAKGFAPTRQELADHLGLAWPQAAQFHLEALKRKGRVTWDERRSRTLRVVQP